MHDYFRDDVPCRKASGLGSDERVLSEVRVFTPPRGLYNILIGSTFSTKSSSITCSREVHGDEHIATKSSRTSVTVTGETNHT